MQPDELSFDRRKGLELGKASEHVFPFVAWLEDLGRRPADGTAEIVHRISLSGKVDGRSFELNQVVADFDVNPYGTCLLAVPKVDELNGLRLQSGYRKAVLEVMGGTSGCTHILSLALELTQLHTLVTYAKMREAVPYASRSDPEWVRKGLEIEPRLENACLALASESPVIAEAKKGGHQ